MTNIITVQTTAPFQQSFFNPKPPKQSSHWMMNTWNVIFLWMSQSFSCRCKNYSPQFYPKDMIQFLCNCTLNLLKGNLECMKRCHNAKIRGKLQLFSLWRTFWKQRRDVLASKKSCNLQILNVFTPPVISQLSWYGAVFFLSLLLRTTKVWLRNNIQNRKIENIEPNKSSPTKLICFKRK